MARSPAKPTAIQPRDGEVGKLREEIQTLRSMILRITEMSSFENVVVKGFSDLSAHLEPLRDLAPQRTRLSPDLLDRLSSVRNALARPDWSGVDSIDPPLRGDPSQFGLLGIPASSH